jgi:hypothetical protein
MEIATLGIKIDSGDIKTASNYVRDFVVANYGDSALIFLSGALGLAAATGWCKGGAGEVF